jgi:hypothetical protein
MNQKSFLYSKTLWFNFAGALVLIADQAKLVPLPDLAKAWLPTIGIVGNVILRFLTTSQVSLTMPEKDDV